VCAEDDAEVTAAAADQSNESASDDDDDDESSSSSTGSAPPLPPGEADDGETIELEIEDTSDDEALFRQIVAAAAARGIPLDFLAGHRHRHGHGGDEDDDEDIEYPFDPPTSLEDVATFMKSEKCRKILILSGAGMSVASGIPDFRSRDGFYATLNADLLSCTSTEQVERIREDPCYCLDQHLFLENPLPCLEVNREFILGTQSQKWKPTLAHRALTITTGGKLCRWYTQNIDGLEDACCGGGGGDRSSLSSPPPLSLDQIIAVHGSMDRAACAECRAEMNFDVFCQRVKTQIKDISGQDPSAPKTSTPIVCDSCGAPSVKPNIVLFRSSLPPEFFQKITGDVEDVDLLLVIGTSLHVAPANSLVWRVPKTCMRVLINREAVGWHLGMNFNKNHPGGGGSKRDYFAQGNCEDTALDLLEHFGHLQDIERYFEGLPVASAELAHERIAAAKTKKAVEASTTTCKNNNGDNKKEEK
jgi:NAD-dependent deacetylase sirtuin 2